MKNELVSRLQIAFVVFGLTIMSSLMHGCSVSNDVPPRAAPIGMPTNPPPPRVEGHGKQSNPPK